MISFSYLFDRIKEIIIEQLQVDESEITMETNMEKGEFDIRLARDHCMEYGMVVGLLCSASFLCSMYGTTSLLLGQLGNVLGITAFVTAGVLIRHYGRKAGRLTFGRSCYMALLTYAFAIMVTAVVQYIYFRYLDAGRLANQVEQIIQMPEYRQWMEQLTVGQDLDEVVDQLLQMTRNPERMTMQLIWMNLIFALLLTVPTALMGKRK